jgi:hypothetical protein
LILSSLSSGRAADFEVVAGQPFYADAHAFQDFDDTVDFFDAREGFELGDALVQQAGAEQGDGSVLAGLEGDFAVQFVAAFDPQVHGRRSG